jgi:hypothetical protein
MADRTGRLARLRKELSWQRRSWSRRLLGERSDPLEHQGLAAYAGLMRQAWEQRPLRPEVVAQLWHDGRFQSALGQPAFFNPSRREREGSSHHYGHDIQLKRHAGLPLVGPPLPFLLEHGLKVSRASTFEPPRPWARGGYLCMGERRAGWLRERHGCQARAIGPWILYARPLLDAETLQSLRDQLGRSLLVVLAHSWDSVQRHIDLPACIEAVQNLAQKQNYTTVIWLRHWQDLTALSLPNDWIVACNGHRSNPWFLDGLRTLLELCDAMVSNAFGTHLGYAVALDRRLHWLNIAAEQDLSAIRADQAEREREEWQERQRLSSELEALLRRQERGALDAASLRSSLRTLLNPYWGFDQIRRPGELRQLLSRPSEYTSR